MPIISHDQFVADGEKGLHNIEYLLKKLSEISDVVSVVETTTNGEYTISATNIENNELLLQLTVRAEERLEVLYLFLDSLYSKYKQKPVLRVLN